jgi:hypothetical protein
MDGTSMHPQIVPCDRCGQLASIINATPIYANADALLDSDTTRILPEFSCRINCPKCGMQVQVIKSKPVGD